MGTKLFLALIFSGAIIVVGSLFTIGLDVKDQFSWNPRCGDSWGFWERLSCLWSAKIQGDKSWDCASSQFNIYSNLTEARYVNGRCYVPETYWEETKGVCHETMFSISCYESSTPHKELHARERCFYLETGEAC